MDARNRLAAALLAAGMLFAAMPAAAEPLGRLFFSPERRAALERQRLLNIQEAQAQVIEGATLSVNGIVQRSSGKSTAWVNGMPQHDNASATGVIVDIDRSNPARTTVVAGEEAPASLRVGESINRATRETSSGVDRGIIIVPASRPAAKRRD
jgi:hypothetical protein